MPVHIHAPTAKCDALHLKAEPLLQPILAGYADGASSPEHSVPRQSVKRVESPNYLPRGSRKSGRGGDLSVSCHLPFGNLPDRVRKND
jgi:hypothetical protein